MGGERGRVEQGEELNHLEKGNKDGGEDIMMR